MIEPRTTKETTVCRVAARYSCWFLGGDWGSGSLNKANVETKIALTPIYDTTVTNSKIVSNEYTHRPCSIHQYPIEHRSDGNTYQNALQRVLDANLLLPELACTTEGGKVYDEG